MVEDLNEKRGVYLSEFETDLKLCHSMYTQKVHKTPYVFID